MKINFLIQVNVNKVVIVINILQGSAVTETVFPIVYIIQLQISYSVDATELTKAD